MAASSPELLTMDDHGNIPTTTISTIAVQSGNTRIVIALLQSKEWIQLKIQEMHPAMTDIGTNLREATDLYQQHEKVLEKLQTKQSPVEELLRQADDLISNQKPRGEVYSAMAENLGLAWKDLNAQLEQRRQILEQAVAFFAKSELFADSLELIKKSISETFLPSTVEATTTMLIRHKEERKTALSNSMRMMSEGQLLLEKLTEVAIHSMGDSRPAHMQHAARQATAFVERHMENLQDKWRHLESLWNQKKTQLEQCLLKCQLENQMKEAETWIRTKGTDYVVQKNLGDSLANSEILHHEHHKIENECKEKQEHCLKIVKSAEDACRKGNYAGEELKSRAYNILSECTDLTAAMEQRRQLLADSVQFFNKAQTALTKLDQIEIQLTTSETPPSSSTVEEIAKSAIQDGRQILNTTGITEPGAQGIVRKVEELESKKKKLSDQCKAKESAVSEKSLAFKKFCEKYDELINWLSNYGLFFVQRSRDMGTTQTAAKTFVEQHEATQNDLRMKMMDVEALLRMVPNLVRSGGEEAQVVHSKSEDIKQQFSGLRTTLDNRILIGQRYLAFLKLSTKVTKEIDEFESLIKQAIEVPNQTTFRNIEEKQLTLRQEIMQVNNNGRNFLEDARKVDDMYLNMSQPCATVEDILSRLELRNVTLTTQWLNFQNEISATKETLTQWENFIKESNKVIKSAQDLEARMFPVIPRELTRVDSILSFLEGGMSVIMPQIKTVQKEMDTFLKKAETFAHLEDSHREGKQTVEKLKTVQQGFQKKLTDYQVLVSMMTAFFKNFDELEKLIDMQESQYRITVLPNDVTKMETLIHDHDSNKPTVMELFKFSNTEAQTLINKINEAEPPEAAASDREKISSVHGARKEAFDRSWDEHKNKLEHHYQLCIFNRDMHLINQQIEDLNNQLASLRQSYGESLPSAVHTSEAFLQFEKTIELLQIRIYEFISTAERMIRDQRVDSSRVSHEIETMQKKWSTFRTEVTTNRKLIDVAIEYYKTIEEAEEWLKEGSRLLISVARKSSTCTKESDADTLKSEVQQFLDKGRNQQDERLRKISSLSMQLFGTQAHVPTETIACKNRDMMESFSSISTELTTLTTNIRITQQAKIVEQKGKEEMSAVLHAAQAEAEAAKAAAAAAQEAAKIAEAAAKAIPPKAPEPAQRPPRFIRQLTDAEINEGTKFTFECEVEGYPTPQVQWFKDSILVENNPDYQTSMEKGICRLTIEETFSEDTAKFTCRATNPDGIAETQSQLVVKEAHAQNELIPPHFVQEPLDSTVAEGEPHQLECQVFGNPLPLVSWFKDDVCIDYSTDYSITYNNGFCTLKIDEAHTDHQGRYTCRAVNQVGQVACSANLLVSSSLAFERPTIVVPLSNVMARAGQKLRLECTISGQPEPQITWLHNSKSLKETRDSKLHFDGRNATLVITEAFPKDAGTYTIIARNKAGEAVSSCNVSVKGRLPLETSDSEIASDIEPAKPQVKQQLEDQTVLEGNKVRMDCVIVGQPEPEVIWYHNGKPVKESDDFQLLFEGDRCTLIIKTAYLEDGGTYKCVAINSGGEASSICQLKVEPVTELVQQKSEFSQKDILISVEKIEPPKFLKLLESSSVTEGQEVILECKVVAEPQATLSWYKDGKPIYSSQQYQIISDDSGLSQLRIPCAQINDRGTYSVRAQNKGGEAQSFCTVVISPPVNFVQRQPQIPPTFLQHIENKILLPGNTARFETVVEGTPKPQVRWNFQGKPVPKDLNHLVGGDGNKHWIIIQNVGKDHAGRYSAIAENDAGIATTSALLTVEDRSLQTTDSTCFEQTAQSMVMTKKKTMVQSSFISSVSEVSDVDYQPPEFPSFSSLQSQQLVKMEQSTFTSAPLPYQPIPQPPPLEPLPPPTVPPKFTRPVSAMIVTEGEKITLEAQYEGIPEPSIQWFKDDIELKNKPGLTISSPGGGRTSLLIMKSVPNDGGRYMCVASNSAGKANSLAQVTVKVRPAPTVPPKFIRPVSTVAVMEGEKVLLEAQYEGLPEPTIQWFKDDIELTNRPGLTISKPGGGRTSVYILNGVVSDSGRYTCIASNTAGRANSTADVRVSARPPPSVPPKFVVPVSTAAVTEGDMILLEAQYEGLPEPTIQWFKDDIELYSRPGLTISMHGGGRTSVNILNSSMSDGGRYTCIALNSAGRANSTADVMVIPRPPPSVPPKFIRPVSTAAVMEGEQILLEAQYEGLPEPTVQWFKDDTELRSRPGLTISMPGGGRTSVYIQKSTENDSGRYTCVVLNTAGRANSTADVTVALRPPPSVPPKFIKPVSTAAVIEGEQILLEAQYEGLPEPSVQWFKNDIELRGRPGLTISIPGGGRTSVYIQKSIESDSGRYTCVALNTAGRANSTADVRVSPRPPPSVPPKFMKPVSTAAVTEGEKILLEAQYEGLPEPTIQWFKNDVELHSRPGLTISIPGGGKTSVCISKSIESDSGRYTCVISNNAGRANSTADVRVTPLPPPSVPPKFIRPVTTASVTEGEKILLEAQYEGLPEPTIQWFKNDVELRNRPGITIATPGGGKTSVYILKSVENDSGRYTCVISNIAGRANSTADVRVTPRPPPSLPPKFIRPVTTASVTEGEKILLEAQYEGLPEPTIQWFKNDVELYNRPGLTIATPGGGRTSVYIMRSVESDSGRYTCVISNIAGRANSTADVRVTPRPPPSIPPKFIRPVTTANVTEGEKILLEAQYEGLPEPTIQWFKNDIQLYSRPGLTIATPGGGNTSICIMRSAENDSGRYTCVISNTAGRANSTADVRVTPKPPPSVPPKFIRPVTTASVTEDEKILLEAQYEGLPEPTIQWFKNDVELYNRPGLTISAPGGGRTSVYILKSVENDSGRYTCVISNIAGRANSTADVTVIPRPPPSVPAKFLRPLTTTSVKEGENILLETQYEGLPEPTIQWFKNDVELRNKPGLAISIPGGGRTSVHISKCIDSDSGRYTCVISNIAGRANSSADVTVIPKPPPSVPPKFVKPVTTASVTVGEKILLEAQYEGLPEPIIQWFKDDVELRSRPGLTISAPGGGKTSVYIMKSSENDSGRYACVASNTAGRANSIAEVKVKPLSVPPKFITQVPTASVTAGERILLEAQYEGLPEPTIKWYKDDAELRSRPGLTISTPGRGRTSICIMNSAETDCGQYTCIASNNAGRATSIAEVGVKTPSLPPKFIRPVPAAAVTAGDKIYLEAQFEGLPEPTIQWYKDGLELRSRPGLTISTPGGGKTSLYIMNSVENDSGQYTCVASNMAGKANSIAEVRVTTPSLPPKFIRPVPAAAVTAGDKIYLEAQFEGLPEPTIQWFKDGIELRNRPGLTISTPGGGKTSLYILNSVENDSGQYNCVASNMAGKANSIAEVRVTIPSVPPKFIRPVPAAAVTEGDKIFLEAQFEGLPEPIIQWFKDGIELRNRPGLTISIPGGGKTSLYIMNSVESDSGQYICVASNIAGKANSIAEVRVDPRPPPSIPPKFIRPVPTASVTEGEKILLEAQYEGFPEPAIQWFKDDLELVNRPGLTISAPVGGRTSIYILKSVERDSGRYTCVASNTAGKANSTAEVRVKRPTIPPKFLKPVPAALLTRGEQLSLEAQYEGLPEPNIQWFKDGIELKNKPGLTISTTGGCRTSLFIPKASESDSGQYSCVAANIAGRATSNAEVKVKPPAKVEPPSVPPKFTRPVSTAIVSEGEKLLLEAQYEGSPEPNIQWFKDNVEVRSRPGLTISAPGGGRTSIYIEKSVESDGGRYSCIASNIAGKATSIAEVKVKPYREAPKFKKKLDATVVKSGSKMTLQVEVTGVPKPEVKWYRNGGLLQDCPDCRISSSDNTHTLHINEVFPDDSGNYMVVASNVAGEAKSIADLIVEEEKSPDEEKAVTYQEFSTVQQKKEMITKISLKQAPSLEPYSLATEVPKAVEPPEPVKVPSPPPIPAVKTKVWAQSKPEPFPAPAITEAPEPIPIPPEPVEEIMPVAEFPVEIEPIQTVSVEQTRTFQTSVPEEQLKGFPSSAPVTAAMSESFVKKSIMKFSHPDTQQQTRAEERKTTVSSKSSTQQPLVQNGFDVESKTTVESFSSMKQSSFTSESKTVSTSESVSKPKSSQVPVPKKFVPKAVAPSVQKEKDKSPQSLVPVWKPKKESEPKPTWKKVQAPQETASTSIQKTVESKFTSTGIPQISESAFSATETKTTTTASSQTSSIPTSFYSTESSTTTRTSYSKEEISITKKYEMVLEHTSETISSDSESKPSPKPIIKKEVKEGPKPKKEVVIEEEPVVGAEVKPPLFSKVRGAESLRKIYTEY